VTSPVSAQTIASSASTICHLDVVIWQFHECRLATRRAGALSKVTFDRPGGGAALAGSGGTAVISVRVGLQSGVDSRVGPRRRPRAALFSRKIQKFR